MTKLIETLEAAGWVDTTMGECRPGEEVVIVDNGHVRHEFITRADVTRGTVSDAKGFQWAAETPAQRPPRPEYAPGTVALIRVRGGKSLVRALKIRGHWILPGSKPAVEDRRVPVAEDDHVEVVRVLLHADQDTPPITDEMVERAAEACYYARNEEPAFCPEWGDVCEEHPALAHLYRRGARAALKSALGEEKEK